MNLKAPMGTFVQIENRLVIPIQSVAKIDGEGHLTLDLCPTAGLSWTGYTSRSSGLTLLKIVNLGKDDIADS